MKQIDLNKIINDKVKAIIEKEKLKLSEKLNGYMLCQSGRIRMNYSGWQIELLVQCNETFETEHYGWVDL